MPTPWSRSPPSEQAASRWRVPRRSRSDGMEITLLFGPKLALLLAGARGALVRCASLGNPNDCRVLREEPVSAWLLDGSRIVGDPMSSLYGPQVMPSGTVLALGQNFEKDVSGGMKADA